MTPVGIVSALPFEACALANKNGVTVRRCAISGTDADEAVRELHQSGTVLIVSWGTAGALSAGLKAGDLCLPEYVLDRKGDRIATDVNWRRRLLQSLQGFRFVHSGMLLDSARIVGEPRDKRELGQTTGAQSVDMESGPIGTACLRLNVPYLVVRVIIDELDDRLPDLIAQGVAGGSLHTIQLLGFVVRPRLWGTLVRLGKRHRKATASLSVAAEALRRCL